MAWLGSGPVTAVGRAKSLQVPPGAVCMPSSPDGATITAGFEGAGKRIMEMYFRMEDLPGKVPRPSVRQQRKAHVENQFC